MISYLGNYNDCDCDCDCDYDCDCVNDDFFEMYDINMKEIDDLYNECEYLYIDNKKIKEKENDIYIVYMMYSVVIYMLIYGSNMNELVKNHYINTLFPKPLEIYIDKMDTVESID